MQKQYVLLVGLASISFSLYAMMECESSQGEQQSSVGFIPKFITKKRGIDDDDGQVPKRQRSQGVTMHEFVRAKTPEDLSQLAAHMPEDNDDFCIEAVGRLVFCNVHLGVGAKRDFITGAINHFKNKNSVAIQLLEKIDWRYLLPIMETNENNVNAKTPLINEPVSNGMTALKMLANSLSQTGSACNGCMNCTFIDLLLHVGASAQCDVQGSEPITHQVALHGNMRLLQRLCQKDANTRAVDGMGNTILHKVIRGYGISKEIKQNMLSFLLSTNAKHHINTPNRLGERPLTAAIKKCDERSVQELLSHNADPAIDNAALYENSLHRAVTQFVGSSRKEEAVSNGHIIVALCNTKRVQPTLDDWYVISHSEFCEKQLITQLKQIGLTPVQGEQSKKSISDGYNRRAGFLWGCHY